MHSLRSDSSHVPSGVMVTIINRYQNWRYLSLDEAILDQTAERILKLIFNWTDHREERALTLEADHDFARRVAEESMVLLKNEGVLPLKREEKVLFVGEFAEKPCYQGGGSSHINSFKVSDALSAARSLGQVSYTRGFSGQEDVYDESLAVEAIEAAKEVDKVVVFAGLPDSFESEGYDREHMELPGCQNRLIEEQAIANSQPLRGVISFGIMTPEELNAEIEKYTN